MGERIKEQIEKVLAELKYRAELQGCVLVSGEGSLIASNVTTPLPTSLELLSTQVAAMGATSKSVSESAGTGNVETIIALCSDGIILSKTDGMTLICIAERRTNLGLAMMELEKAFKILERLLSVPLSVSIREEEVAREIERITELEMYKRLMERLERQRKLGRNYK